MERCGRKDKEPGKRDYKDSVRIYRVRMVTPPKVLEGYKSRDRERLRLEHKFSDLIEEELRLSGLGNKSRDEKVI